MGERTDSNSSMCAEVDASGLRTRPIWLHRSGCENRQSPLASGAPMTYWIRTKAVTRRAKMALRTKVGASEGLQNCQDVVDVDDSVAVAGHDVGGRKPPGT